jgi:anaerobic carbon-monoxide dehydrogenase iron sulfur subunit
MKVLAARPELCVGCALCEQTCAETFFKVTDRLRSTIRITILEDRRKDAVMEFCSQCGECIAVCPTQALYRAKNGIVRLKKADCTGCLACVGFCPTLTMYAAPADPVPFKCIACAKCVESCPVDALYMTDVDVPAPVSELTRSIRQKTGAESHGH